MGWESHVTKGALRDTVSVVVKASSHHDCNICQLLVLRIAHILLFEMMFAAHSGLSLMRSPGDELLFYTKARHAQFECRMLGERTARAMALSTSARSP